MPTTPALRLAVAADPGARVLATALRGKARSTQHAYRMHLKRACGRDPDTFPWHTLSGEVGAGWLEACGGGASHRNGLRAALSAILRAQWALGYSDADGRDRALAQLPRDRRRTLPRGRALDAREVRALFASCRGALGMRDRAMLALLLGAGLRRSEAAGLRREDVEGMTAPGNEAFEVLTSTPCRNASQSPPDAPQGALHQAPVETMTQPSGIHPPILRVRGKGGKEREVPLPAWAWRELRPWLDRLPDGPVLGIGAQGIYERLQTLARRAGVEVSPHDCRRTYITHLLAITGDLSLAARLAGHSGVDTTRSYDRRGLDAARAALCALPDPLDGP